MPEYSRCLWGDMLETSMRSWGLYPLHMIRRSLGTLLEHVESDHKNSRNYSISWGLTLTTMLRLVTLRVWTTLPAQWWDRLNTFLGSWVRRNVLASGWWSKLCSLWSTGRVINLYIGNKLVYKDSMVGALLLFDILGDRIKQYLPLFHEHMIKL